MEYLISIHTAAAGGSSPISRGHHRSRTTFIYSYHIIYTYTTINFAGYDRSIDTFIKSLLNTMLYQYVFPAAVGWYFTVKFKAPPETAMEAAEGWTEEP